MRNTHHELDPLFVISQDTELNVITTPHPSRENLQETTRTMDNEYLSAKVLSGLQKVESCQFHKHDLILPENES